MHVSLKENFNCPLDCHAYSFSIPGTNIQQPVFVDKSSFLTLELVKVSFLSSQLWVRKPVP